MKMIHILRMPFCEFNKIYDINTLFLEFEMKSIRAIELARHLCTTELPRKKDIILLILRVSRR